MNRPAAAKRPDARSRMLCEDPLMERQQDYVLRTVEERGVRLIRLWFTDVLGQLKSVAISPAELENAFEEGMHFDGSAIDGFSRVQESDVLARPDPNTFELLPWGDADDVSGPHVLRHPEPRRHPVRGRPPPGPEAQPRPGPRAGLHVHDRARDGVLLLRRRRPEHPARAARHRLATSTSPPPTWPATCASGRSSCSRPWGSPSSTRSTRTPPANTRSTCATPTPSRWPTTS